jgi:DNA-binding transcriptional regulator YiaG
MLPPTPLTRTYIIILPEHVRYMRDMLRETQQEFGARVGVSAPAVHGWEHGRRRPNQCAAVLLARLYQDLLGRVER